MGQDTIFNLDFALENAWQRSFKRMKRGVAASEDNNVAEKLPQEEDAQVRNHEWELAKLQQEVRQV